MFNPEDYRLDTPESVLVLFQATDGLLNQINFKRWESQIASALADAAEYAESCYNLRVMDSISDAMYRWNDEGDGAMAILNLIDAFAVNREDY